MIGLVTVRDLVLIGAVAVGLLLVPGLCFTFAAGGRGRPLAEWVALGFGTSVAVTVVLAELVHRVGGDVVWMSAILAGLALGAVPLGFLRAQPAGDRGGSGEWPGHDAAAARGGRRRDWLVLVVILAAAGCTALAVWQGLQLTPTTDTFYHVASARSLLSTGGTRVTDPFFGARSLPPDPTAGTWPSLVAAISLFAGQDPLPVNRVLVPLLAFVVPFGFYALARRFGAPGWGALLATGAFLAGGMALDFRNIVYPSRVAILVLWAALIWLVDWLESGGWGKAVAAVVLFAGAGTIHLSVAEAVLLGLAVTAVAAALWRAKGTLKLVALVAAVVVLFAALAYPSLAPLRRSVTLGVASGDAAEGGARLPVWRGPLGLTVVTGEGVPGLGAFALLVSLAASVALWLLGRGERDAARAAPIGFGAVLPALLLNGVATSLVLERFWYHVIRLGVALRFVPYAVLGALMPDGRTWREVGRPWRWALLVAPVVLVGLGAVQSLDASLPERFMGPSVAQSIAYAKEQDRSVALAPLARELARLGARKGTVVVAPPNMGYELAGLLGYRTLAVPATHLPASYVFDEGQVRLREAERLYDPGTAPDERADILARRDAELVVAPALLTVSFLDAGWQRVGQVGELRIFGPGSR